MKLYKYGGSRYLKRDLNAIKSGPPGVNVRCYQCSAIQKINASLFWESLACWKLPCSECGAAIGPGGDHPTRIYYGASTTRHSAGAFRAGRRGIASSRLGRFRIYSK